MADIRGLDSFFLNKENIGRRLWRTGGELAGTGDDGGLDLGNSSEKIAEDCCGLDVGGAEKSCAGEDGFTAGRFVVSKEAVPSLPSAVSTRLRFVGGSSS